MAIDGISATKNLVAALRGEITRRRKHTSGVTAGEAQSATHSAQRWDMDALRRELAEIAAHVDDNDQDAMSAARPRVVRAVLLWEFGSGFREHPQWQPTLDRIVSTLASSDQHRDAFAKMIQELRTESRF